MRSWSDDELTVAVISNITMAGTLRELGLSTSPGNYKFVGARIKSLGLDTTHFRGRSHGSSISPRAKSLEEYLTLGSAIGSSYLKTKVLRAGLLRNQCFECKLEPSWNGKDLTLQLDHINGDSSDNRIDNLRILCPNCHTQTKTFTGKNLPSRYRSVTSRCVHCDTPVTKGGNRCMKCAGLYLETKTNWPPPEQLLEEVTRTSYVAVAAKLGVSDTAVKKYLRRKLGFAPKKHNYPVRQP